MQRLGLDRMERTVEEAVAIEPALAHAAPRLVGATWTPSDESGDAYLFTTRLAGLAEAKGVRFLAGREIRGLRATPEKVAGVVVAARGRGDARGRRLRRGAGQLLRAPHAAPGHRPADLSGQGLLGHRRRGARDRAPR